ncbi:DNA primase [Enterovirga aerilata]|uniref:DNA primase n=1 Tax=Enterovirga aerilata TaxID=2730920 RepID=A0A849IA50_9HYPH|nr:DNA primase [Enterovirga sp. DB1703]
MRYPPHLLDEIRARLPVSSVVGRKVRLKKAGREWRGLSPFNAEKTPSFYANDQKGFYHDFSSGKHGDIFTFLMETEGLSFPEAVERLAAEAGVDLPKPTPELERAVERRRDLYDVLEMACRFFEKQLALPAGQKALAYLDGRGITAETRREFRMGYAPDARTALFDHLRSEGVERDLILRAGLAIEPDDGRSLYDRFRGRVIIPIQDMRGRVVAFGGRALAPDQQPKYLNSPETELFRKGEIVFNFHRARQPAHEANSAIVVEGYLDAVSVYQAGIRNVVATLGTAFTEEQIALLWRLAPEPVICFDGDRAGRNAAFRAVDRIVPALKTGFTFRFAFLPPGQDPDDAVRQAGPDAFRAILDEAKSFWDVIWLRETEAARLDSENGQAVFEKRIREVVGQIADPTLRRRYELTARLQVSDYLWRLSKRQVQSRLREGVAMPALPNFFSGEPTRLIGLERVFLGMCVHYPDLVEQHRDRIASMNFRGEHAGTPFSSFVSDLLRVVDEEDVREFRAFYLRLSPGFSPTLDFLHGHAVEIGGQEILPWGYNLFARFPVLQSPVPERFIEECFSNFMELLWLRDLEDELKTGVEEMPADPDDSYSLWLVHLQHDILEMRERVLRKELELAEEATLYRSVGRGLAVAADPRGMFRQLGQDRLEAPRAVA